MSSLERALDLLVALEKSGRSMRLSELSKATDIHKATAQRLLSVLERRSFVKRSHGQYQVGSAVVPLAYAFLGENSLSKAALPVLEQLTSISGETSSLFVRDGFDRVVIRRVNSPHPLRYILQVGQRLPVYLGSSGRVLAAAMPESELKAMIAQLPEVRLRNGRILTKEDLLARIEETRQKGFAVSVQERIAEVVSIAAPITVPVEGTIGAVTITGPLSRMSDERVRQLVGDVLRAADEVARVYSLM